VAGYSTPYAFANYLGEWANDAAALIELRARKWDSTADGLGLPRNGMTYYATGTNTYRGYQGGAWANFVTPGASTLDFAYDAGGAGLGRSITADAGAVTITVPDNSSCRVLELTQNDTTNDPDALLITNAGTNASIQLAGATRWIESDSGSLRIQMTANDANAYNLQFFAENLGVGGTADIGIKADNEIIINSTTGKLSLHGYNSGGIGVEVEATAGGGSVNIGGTALTNQINLGTNGARNIYVGSAVAATLTLEAVGASSWVVDGAGATPATPLILRSGAAGSKSATLELLSGGDVGLTCVATSALAQRLVIAAANAGVGTAIIDIDADDAITIDSLAAGISLDAAGASNFSTSTGALTLSGVGLDLNSTGPVTIDASAANSITIGGDANTGSMNFGTGASQRTITVGNATLATSVLVNTGTGNFNVNTTQLVVEQANGNIGIGLSTWGTASAKVIGLASGTAPTTSPADAVQVWSADRGGVALKAALHMRTENGFTNVLGDFCGFGTATPLQKIDVQSGAIRFDYVPTISAAGVTFADGAGGSNTAGDHRLKFTAVNPLGETELGTQSGIYTVHTNEKIDVSNIPVSPDPTVTSRNVYATRTGPGATWYLIAGLLPNNTATTCTIDVADVSLVTAGSAFNNTSGYLYAGTTQLFRSDSAGNWSLGKSPTPLVSGYNFISIGSNFLSFMDSVGNWKGNVSAAGNWHLGNASSAGTQLLSLEGEGARQVFMDRRTVADSAGNSLSVVGGGATLGATNRAGGPLYLIPGTATGAASAASSLWCSPVGAAGVTDNTPVQVLTAGPKSGGAAGSIAVGIGTILPTSLLDLERPGSAKSIVDFLEITNSANAADMDGTGTGILFNQWYYDAATPAVADAGRIAVVAEKDWLAASNQDACMTFCTALNGTVAEGWRIASSKAFSNTGATGTAYIHMKAGTTTASQAPMKYTMGSLLATAEEGTREYSVSTMWMTPIGTQRESIVGCAFSQYETIRLGSNPA